jgi:outer membrane protein assembly factor BamE (lipoprotein component of BamABCDE complex)
MKRKIMSLVLAAALAVPAMGSSCEEDVENLEDVAGENDRQYRADMKKIKLGITKREVRQVAGRPRDRQTMRTEFGRSDYWYYGS